MRPRLIQAVILLKPAGHLARCVLKGLVQRPGIADSQNVSGRFRTGPPGGLPFKDGECDPDIEGDFYSGAAYLAASLSRMTITQKKQRSRHGNGEKTP